MKKLDIEIQSYADDVHVYGWSLEVRWKYDGNWFPWVTHWNHKIYQSQKSALDAASKIYTSHRRWEDYQWRITPLYKMNVPEYRQYKIDRLLNDHPKEDTFVTAWKVKEDFETQIVGELVKVKKGEIFLKTQRVTIRVATYIRSTIPNQGYLLTKYLLPMGLAEEIDISEEKWIHPHLCKELKRKLKINK